VCQKKLNVGDLKNFGGDAGVLGDNFGDALDGGSWRFNFPYDFKIKRRKARQRAHFPVAARLGSDMLTARFNKTPEL
jgi:hypothetical protein